MNSNQNYHITKQETDSSSHDLIIKSIMFWHPHCIQFAEICGGSRPPNKRKSVNAIAILFVAVDLDFGSW